MTTEAKTLQENVNDFFRKNSRVITVLAVLAIAGVLAIVIGIEVRKSQEERNAAELYVLENDFEDWQSNFDEENPSAEEMLSTIADYTFRGGSYADNRRVYMLAEVHEMLEEYETAAEHFFRVSEASHGYLAPLALLRSALLYEQAGKIDIAQELFVNYVDTYDEAEEPRVLFTLGRLAELNEAYEDAEGYYTQIIDNHSASDWRNFAYNRIIVLKSSNKLSNN